MQDERQASQTALATALGEAKTDALKEAIHILWDGMVADEFVSGKLEPIADGKETQPDSRPAEAVESAPEAQE